MIIISHWSHVHFLDNFVDLFRVISHCVSGSHSLGHTLAVGTASNLPGLTFPATSRRVGVGRRIFIHPGVHGLAIGTDVVHHMRTTVTSIFYRLRFGSLDLDGDATFTS
jgi:hypothetical protein